MIEQSLIIEMEENIFVLPSLWSDDMHIEAMETFGNSYLGGINESTCSFSSAETLAKADGNKSLLIDFFYAAS